MVDDGLNKTDEAVEFPIDGTLDLHTFDPRDLKELIPEYLSECRKRGILLVRIIHGKGTGALRESVHAILAKSPYVDEYYLASELNSSMSRDFGNWGATIVRLIP